MQFSKSFLCAVILCLAAALHAQTPPSYIDIDYAPLTDTPLQGSGTFTGMVYYRDYTVTGAGHSFNATAGKKYKITANFTGSSSAHIEAVISILKQGTLQGDLENNTIAEAYRGGVSPLELTLYYKANTSGSTRILLTDHEENELNYTIKVEEDNSAWYIDVDYTTVIPTDGTKITGSVNASDDNFLIYNYSVTGKGYGFNVTKDNIYKITVTFTSAQNFDEDTGFMILKSGTLQGEYDDFFSDGAGDSGGEQITVTRTVTAKATEQLKILLVDLNAGSYSYEVSIENMGEVPATVTLSQFLSQTTKTINYNDNLTFATSGKTVDRVIGDPDMNFRWDTESYYAVAYKITLATGNRIKIHSSIEGDSYLYIFKENGTGYTHIKSDDDSYMGEYEGSIDGLDSYLDFTATSSGTYYIVISDIRPEAPGDYFLRVWNTAEEPGDITPIKNRANPVIGGIGVQTISNSIVLTNLPSNAKVEVYNIQGALVRALPATPQPRQGELSIPIQSKGMYIIKVGNQTFRAAVR